MKGGRTFSPAMGRSQDEQNMGRREMKKEGKKGEEVGWWLRGWGEVGWRGESTL